MTPPLIILIPVSVVSIVVITTLTAEIVTVMTTTAYQSFTTLY